MGQTEDAGASEKQGSEVVAGDPAPAFAAPRDGGGVVSSSALAGQPYVLYFYPKDDTSGCTKEALDFTERAAAFAACGVRVIGVSKDTVAKHDAFIAKRGLGVVLLSDAEGDLCERFGVWVRKSMYGRSFMGVERATFLVGADGVVARVWRKVKTPGHAQAVLDAALELAPT